VLLVDGINRFIDLFLDTFRQFGRGTVWLLLLAFFLVNWLVLYAHYNFTSPLFYTVVTGWVSLIGEGNKAAFTHYPAHLYYLSEYFGWAKFGVALIIEGLLLGAVARIFGRRFLAVHGGRPSGRSLLASWPHLVVVWLIINVLIQLAGEYVPLWFEPLLSGPRRILAFTAVGMPCVFVLILAVFFFAIPSIMVLGDGAVKALGRSARIFIRNPLTCLFLAGFILALPVFFSVLSGYSPSIIERFNPGLVYWILWASLASEVVANFFWMGTGVRFLAGHHE